MIGRLCLGVTVFLSCPQVAERMCSHVALI